MAVSEADREYLRRLGAYKALSHAEALAEHLALPMSERLQRSWELYLRHGKPRDPNDPDDARGFYDRARALGLYQP